jgi:hypothetical protein
LFLKSRQFEWMLSLLPIGCMKFLFLKLSPFLAWAKIWRVCGRDAKGYWYINFFFLNILQVYDSILWLILISCGDPQCFLFFYFFNLMMGIFYWPIIKKINQPLNQVFFFNNLVGLNFLWFFFSFFKNKKLIYN